MTDPKLDFDFEANQTYPRRIESGKEVQKLKESKKSRKGKNKKL